MLNAPATPFANMCSTNNGTFRPCSITHGMNCQNGSTVPAMHSNR